MDINTTADRAYQNLLDKILTNGKMKEDRTGTGTKSIFSHTLDIDMAHGFPLLTTKKMFTKGIIHELLWFLNGDTNIKYLVDNGVNIWTPDAFREYNNKTIEGTGKKMTMDEFKEYIKNSDEFAKIAGELGPVYGKQWVNWEGVTNDQFHRGVPYVKSINQIQNAIDTLNNNPDSRRIIISSWNVGEIDNMALPPCHWAFELYTEQLTNDERKKWVLDNVDWVKDDHDANKYLHRGEPKIYGDSVPKRRLHLKWHQRSVDSFLGLPFNIASYAFLLEMFAQQTNMIAGKLIGDLTNVHIYKNHIPQCEIQLMRIRRESPTLTLTKADDMFSYSYDDFNINDYSHHPSIKGEISV